MQFPKSVGKTDWPWTEKVDSPSFCSEIEWPRISIVTPSLNQGEFIEETIRSVLLQDYSNLEYIIIDGGSTDGTIEILKKYTPWISYWISEPDRGQSHAINKGLSMATGQILSWLNSDDFFAPGALHKVANNWKKETGILVGIGHIININKEIVYTPKHQELTYEKMLYWVRGNDFTQPASFFSRLAWEKAGPLDENLFFCMDVDLWLKISKDFPITQIPDTLAYAYSHENAKTTAFRENMILETILMLSKNGEFKVAEEEGKRLLEEIRAKSKILSTKECLKVISRNLSNRIINLSFHGIKKD